MQSIEVVEESMEFALTRFTEVSGLMDRMYANIDAMHTCCCFYLSYVYNRVRPHKECNPGERARSKPMTLPGLWLAVLNLFVPEKVSKPLWLANALCQQHHAACMVLIFP